MVGLVVGSISHGVMGRRIDSSWWDGSSDRFLMLEPLSYFSFQPVFHD